MRTERHLQRDPVKILGSLSLVFCIAWLASAYFELEPARTVFHTAALAGVARRLKY